MYRLSCLLVSLLLLQAVLPPAAAAPATFYSARYGKRDDQQQLSVRSRSGSGFYANRYGRSGAGAMTELQPRSSRFIPGSRYGKRADGGDEGVADLMPPTLLLGESTICLLVEQPDVYRCTRSSGNSSSEEAE